MMKFMGKTIEDKLGSYDKNFNTKVKSSKICIIALLLLERWVKHFNNVLTINERRFPISPTGTSIIK